MTAWRPIKGMITLLDADLASEKEIQQLFEQERILGCGALDADNAAEFHFELAIAGRKQRVATLDEQGEIFKGRSLENLAAYLHSTLRKVEVTIAGKTWHGPMDIGSVDIEDELETFAEMDVAGDASAELAGESYAGDEALSGASAQSHLPAGRAFSLADIAVSEIPVLAAAQKQQIGEMKCGQLRLLLADKAPNFSDHAILAPDFSLTFILQEDSQAPVLIVNRMGRELRWDWSCELAPFEWTRSDDVAKKFVKDELGAGGMAREAVADIVATPFSLMREALLVDPDDAAYAVVDALGVPREVLGVLQGTRDMEDISGIRIFEPRGAAGSFTEAIAWEVAGQGHIDSRVANAFRTLYLERPWLTSMVAAMQAGAGGVILMNGLQKKPGKSRSLWKMGVGALLISNALSRIATAQYLNSALDRFVGDIRR